MRALGGAGARAAAGGRLWRAGEAGRREAPEAGGEQEAVAVLLGQDIGHDLITVNLLLTQHK